MTRSRYKTIPGGGTYFATATVIDWLPIFSKPELAQVVLASLEHLHETGRMVLHAYVLLENHLHVIASSEDFSGQVRNLKSFTARTIIDYLDQNGPRAVLKKLGALKAEHKKNQRYQL